MRGTPILGLLLACSACSREPERAVVPPDPDGRVVTFELRWASAPTIARTLNELLDASREKAHEASRGTCVLPLPGAESELHAELTRPRFDAAAEHTLAVHVPRSAEADLPRIRELVEQLDLPHDSPALDQD